jgi:hypothetical protein
MLSVWKAHLVQAGYSFTVEQTVTVRCLQCTKACLWILWVRMSFCLSEHARLIIASKNAQNLTYTSSLFDIDLSFFVDTKILVDQHTP